ncbi:pyocin activator PrtN family protein [Acinetobacter sp. ANC 4641]|uniref:pyocin activator PrtN family protein n=1 Tax=Acinetobacter sp. ANC 4641 TaxID=2529847 RepID=UPI001D0D8128|nr:pyocin activator PrtN family protein [Acinetobacter sp. ANC 4641]
MPHLDIAVAKQRAAKCRLPFPAFKVDGNKSEYFVNLSDIALWLDSLQKESRKDWEAMNF